MRDTAIPDVPFDGPLPSPRPAGERVFLLLQGPHGPFFDRLGAMLRAAGATVWRVGFNAGDEFFWSDAAHFIKHEGTSHDWPAHLDDLITRLGVTDLVLYGDVRPVHASARRIASARQLTLHVFEEGYLRPFWISYERGGSNGHSRLMELTVQDMRHALHGRENERLRPPAHWGDTNHHRFYGALYHFVMAAGARRYPKFKTHRNITVREEFKLSLQRLLTTPITVVQRIRATRRIRNAGHPFALVLLQLEHDASFLAHSSYSKLGHFTDEVLDAFARSAPRHHHLVFKSHPLDDGRSHVDRAIRASATRLGIGHRVQFVHGGKLAQLLNVARSVVTVNSTAAQQALWRGLPVKAMGRAVYDKPGLVSAQTLDEFFRSPDRPDRQSYRDYRDYLLETSQVPGGFYAARSRAHVLRLAVDLMLDPLSPYDALAAGFGTHRQQMDQDIV